MFFFVFFRYGVENKSRFTKSLCWCDEQFRSCLDEVGSTLSFFIKSGYFELFGIECFETPECLEEDPNTGVCTEWGAVKEFRRMPKA